MQQTSSAEWRNGWPIVLASALGLCAAVLHVASLSSLILPIQKDTGWSRQQIVEGLAIVSFVSIFVQPFVGVLIDKVGARRVALPGLIVYGCCFFFLSRLSTSVNTWLLGWILLGIAATTITSVWITGVTGYFERSRGMALGIALLGTAVTATLAPIVTTLLADRLGWRNTYLALACFPLLIAFPVALVAFRDARFVRASASTPSLAPRAEEAAAPRVLRSTAFWLMAVASMLLAGAATGFVIHVVPILVQLGLTPRAAASAAGWIGIGSVLGRLLSGYLLDRVPAGLVSIAAALLSAVATGLFLGGTSNIAFLSLAIFLVGIPLGSETACIAILVARYFGVRKFGTAYGALGAFMAIGSGGGPLLGGVLYDKFHSYWYFQITLTIAATLAALCFAMLGPYPTERNVIADDMNEHAYPN